jgi:L-alanine-DL-glutamate epimerase-like enolase superfamily enzyme
VEVETIPLRCELKELFDFAQGWYESRENLIVKITTAEGIEEFRECFGPIKLNKEAAESLLEPLL